MSLRNFIYNLSQRFSNHWPNARLRIKAENYKQYSKPAKRVYFLIQRVDDSCWGVDSSYTKIVHSSENFQEIVNIANDMDRDEWKRKTITNHLE